MLKLRTDIKYVSPEGKLTQAGVEAFQGQIDALSADPSGLTVSSFAASAVVTEAEGIAANDVDTALPTSAAVKGYVDGLGSTGGPTATTSGAQVDFTVPGTANRIVVLFDGVSLSGTDHLLVQLGDSGGIENTGYVSGSRESASSSTAGFIVFIGYAGWAAHGVMELVKGAGNQWFAHHAVYTSTICSAGGGVKTLSDQITTVRLTVTGSNNFDSGNVSVRVTT